MNEWMDHSSHYECVDPDLGAQLWQYDAPTCDPDLQRRLENHIDICHACRIALAIQNRVATGLQSGELNLGGDRADRRRRPFPVFLWGALATAVAALLLIFVLPPRSLDGSLIVRGDQTLRGFTRPVAGEIVWKICPKISWTPIEFARTYRVRIQEVGGSFDWVGESTETDIKLPAGTTLPPSARLRVLLETVPAYLVPPEGIAISMRTGGLREFLIYRATAAPLWLQWIAALGLLLSLFAALRSLLGRR